MCLKLKNWYQGIFKERKDENKRHDLTKEKECALFFACLFFLCHFPLSGLTNIPTTLLRPENRNQV